MNYEQDISIDESSLDLEWLDQPGLLMKYARNAAQARMNLDQSKETLEVVKAELDKKIREDPEKYGINKITEGSILSTLITQEKYRATNEKYLQCKYEADIAQGAVNAINQRKDALENLVRLHGMSYFAGPKIPRDLKWEREQKQKKTDEGIASKMQRRLK